MIVEHPLLAPPGLFRKWGSEKNILSNENLTIYESKPGQVRRVIRKDNNGFPAAAIHLVRPSAKEPWFIHALYTRENKRRQGVMTTLFEETVALHGPLQPAPHLSPTERSFFLDMAKKGLNKAKPQTIPPPFVFRDRAGQILLDLPKISRLPNRQLITTHANTLLVSILQQHPNGTATYSCPFGTPSYSHDALQFVLNNAAADHLRRSKLVTVDIIGPRQFSVTLTPLGRKKAEQLLDKDVVLERPSVVPHKRGFAQSKVNLPSLSRA